MRPQVLKKKAEKARQRLVRSEQTLSRLEKERREVQERLASSEENLVNAETKLARLLTMEGAGIDHKDEPHAHEGHAHEGHACEACGSPVPATSSAVLGNLATSADADDASLLDGKTFTVETRDGVKLVVSRKGIALDDGTTILDLPLRGGSIDLFARDLPKMRYAAISHVLRDDVAAIRRAVDSGLAQGEIVSTFLSHDPAARLSDIVRHFVNAYPKDRDGGGKPGSLYSEALTLAFVATPKGVVPDAWTLDAAGLAVSMVKDRLVVHSPRPEATSLVHATDLHSLPDAPPRLLRKACLVEVPDPARDALFGTTVAIGAYGHEGRINILGMERAPGGGFQVRASWWTPRWTGGELDAGVAVAMDDPITSIPEEARAEHRVWAESAARFLVVFGLLLDVENAPIDVAEESDRSEAERKRVRAMKPAQKAKLPRAWVVRRVSISARARRSRAPETAPSSTSPGVPPGRVENQAIVSGHLKRQPCGPRSSERKLIWVESYEARRWVAPGPVKVVVTS